MVETRRLKTLTSAALSALSLPPGPSTVALSGGADSAALAFLCVESGASVDALHIHHGFPASDRMADAASAVAGDLGLAFQVVAVDLPVGPSPEAQARTARYRVLDAWSGPVLTAHTRDDNAETILMNLARGAGAPGLSGIPRHRPPITWRALLDVSRSETREIATLAELGFVDDPMNDDPTLTRNMVRQRLMPLMRELNPRADEAMARAGANLEADSNLLDSLTPAAGDAVAVSVIRTLPRPLADRMLIRMLISAGMGVTEGRVGRMWEVVLGHSDRQEIAEGRALVRRGALVALE